MGLLDRFPAFTTHYLLMVDDLYSSFTNSAPNLTENVTELADRDLRRTTDDLRDDGETTESSHQWTDEVDSETFEEPDVLTFWKTCSKCNCRSGFGFAHRHTIVKDMLLTSNQVDDFQVLSNTLTRCIFEHRAPFFSGTQRIRIAVRFLRCCHVLVVVLVELNLNAGTPPFVRCSPLTDSNNTVYTRSTFFNTVFASKD